MSSQKEIEAVASLIEEMYNAVINNLKKSLDYYLDEKRPYDSSLVIDDDKINAYERAIESLCMQIFLKETVYSQDFRKVSGALEMVESLERVGDNAYDIKGMGDDLKQDRKGRIVDGTSELAELVMSMLKDGFTSYVKGDAALAEDVLKRDDEADSLYWKLCMKLATENDEGKNDGKSAVYQSHVLKYLERIGDQSTNIAEWVIFIKTGYHKDRYII